jgi:hypothetical protein
MGIKALAYSGARTATGTVTAMTGSTLTVQTASGASVTLATSLVSQLVNGVQPGDGVAITYAKDAAGGLIPHALQITSSPPPANPTGPATPTAPGSPSGDPGSPGSTT